MMENFECAEKEWDLEASCQAAETFAEKGDFENSFDSALDGLLHFKHTDMHSEECYKRLLKFLFASSQKICASTDYDSSIDQMIDDAEKKFGEKFPEPEENGDAYKRLRELVRFEMRHQAILCGKEYEICSTEENFSRAVGKFREELKQIVPESQQEVLNSIGYSLYSDFFDFFVRGSLDMIADAKIYKSKRFRPLQIHAMGKEIRTYINVVAQQNAKPQKSQTVSDWFRTLFVLPAFLFNKLYAINMVELFAVSEERVAEAEKMFRIFERDFAVLEAAGEYEILKAFLTEMHLADCLTVRVKVKADAEKIRIS